MNIVEKQYRTLKKKKKTHNNDKWIIGNVAIFEQALFKLI